MGKKKGKRGVSDNPPIPPEPRLYAIGKDIIADETKRFRSETASLGAHRVGRRSN